MNYQVEFVAQAIYEAEKSGRLWTNEPAINKERFGLLDKAIRLLNEDICVLLHALEKSGVKKDIEGRQVVADNRTGPRYLGHGLTETAWVRKVGDHG